MDFLVRDLGPGPPLRRRLRRGAGADGVRGCLAAACSLEPPDHPPRSARSGLSTPFDAPGDAASPSWGGSTQRSSRACTLVQASGSATGATSIERCLMRIESGDRKMAASLIWESAAGLRVKRATRDGPWLARQLHRGSAGHIATALPRARDGPPRRGQRRRSGTVDGDRPRSAHGLGLSRGRRDGGGRSHHPRLRRRPRRRHEDEGGRSGWARNPGVRQPVAVPVQPDRWRVPSPVRGPRGGSAAA